MDKALKKCYIKSVRQVFIMNNFEYIKNLFVNQGISEEKVTEDASLKDLGIDSLDLVEIMFAAEEELDVHFEDEKLLALKTVGDAVRLLDSVKK